MVLKYKAYNNTDDLIRNVSSDTVLVIDKDTYEYYRLENLMILMNYIEEYFLININS